jgi:hypothetical protein
LIILARRTESSEDHFVMSCKCICITRMLDDQQAGVDAADRAPGTAPADERRSELAVEIPE